MRWRLKITPVDKKGRPYLYPCVLELATENAEDISYDERREAHLWCLQQFGHESERWRSSGWDFKFRDYIDGVAFQIRWG